MSRPTVFLHIGLAKTGTTYLQGLLWANAKDLERGGLTYPGRRFDHFHASIDLRSQPFLGDPGTLRAGTWKRVATQARSAPDRAVISHETLARTAPEDAQRAVESLAPAEVHLIVTVRDFGRQIPAVWQERIKNRSSETYNGFMRNIRDHPEKTTTQNFWGGHDVVEVLERWSVVPPERVSVVTVPPPGAPRDLLWERFASVLGVPADLAEKPPPNPNVSLGVAEAELLRRFNAGFRHTTKDWLTYERAVKTRFTRDILAGLAPKPRLSVPPRYRDWVTERGRQMIAGLQKGGYQIVGDLAELEPWFGDEELVMPGDIPEEQLLEMAQQAVSRLIVRNDELRQRV